MMKSLNPLSEKAAPKSRSCFPFWFELLWLLFNVFFFILFISHCSTCSDQCNESTIEWYPWRRWRVVGLWHYRLRLLREPIIKNRVILLLLCVDIANGNKVKDCDQNKFTHGDMFYLLIAIFLESCPSLPTSCTMYTPLTRGAAMFDSPFILPWLMVCPLAAMTLQELNLPAFPMM